MDMTEAHLRTNKISWRLAPAVMAARIWRRVPSGFKLAREAFNPMSTNSTNLFGKAPSDTGFDVIFTACPAQAASHSRSLFSAAAQGLTGPLPVSIAVSSLVAICFPPFPRLSVTWNVLVIGAFASLFQDSCFLLLSSRLLLAHFLLSAS